MKPGKYKAVAVAGHIKEASTGTEQYVIDFKITEGEFEGEEIRGWFSCSPKAMKYTIKTLLACGCEFKDGDATNLDGLGDLEVVLTIVNEEWNGETRTKIKWVNAPGTSDNAGLLTDEKKSLLRERVKGELMAAKKEWLPF